MKLLEKTYQHRRDCKIIVECENCKHSEEIWAYDDRNYWDNVLPNDECRKCGESSNSLDLKHERIATRYPEGYQV